MLRLLDHFTPSPVAYAARTLPCGMQVVLHWPLGVLNPTWTHHEKICVIDQAPYRPPSVSLAGPAAAVLTHPTSGHGLLPWQYHATPPCYLPL